MLLRHILINYLRQSPTIHQLFRFITCHKTTHRCYHHYSSLSNSDHHYVRTARCANLSVFNNNNPKVSLCGWIDSFRTLSQELAFVVLRDGSGKVQLVIRNRPDLVHILDSQASLESVIHVTGVVTARPSNHRIAADLNDQTSLVEVILDHINVVNRADKLPAHFFGTHESLPNEEIRLKYRYLDLRRLPMQRMLNTRSRTMQAMRRTLLDNEFIEIETPTLFKTTPEGAREFLVPTRKPNLFYTLTQSPQQYKQLLMASGIDRYFQFARCYRDEDQRADRQPEFTQLDLELAWSNPRMIRSLVQDLVSSAFKEAVNIAIDSQTDFPILDYHSAMNKFGSDKPDMRFSNTLEIIDCSDLLDIKYTKSHCLDAVILPHTAFPLTNTDIKLLSLAAGKSSIVIVKFKDTLPNLPFLAQESISASVSPLHERLKHGDVVCFHLRKGKHVQGGSTQMGKWRIELIGKLLPIHVRPKPQKQFAFVWIKDFPLFTPVKDDDKPEYVLGTSKTKWATTHHPFTAPHPDDLPLLNSSPGQVRALHYDLVLNGFEIGGGSCRIHCSELQHKIFTLLDMQPCQVMQFEHLTDALRFGCPPHGGIALGFDRLMSVMLNTNSIRDVIAFPKTSGTELMVGSPCPVSVCQLEECHIAVKEAH